MICRSGDLILCSGRELMSGTINFGISDTFSHLSIAVRMKEGKFLDSSSEEGDLYFLEFNGSLRYCHYTKKVKSGLTISSFEEMKRMYELIAVCSLKDKIVTSSNAEKYVKDMIDKPFDSKPINFLSHWLKIDVGRKRGQGFTCVSATDLFYNQIGIYTPYRIYNPKEFRLLPYFKEAKIIYCDKSKASLKFELFFFLLLSLIIILLFYLMKPRTVATVL